MLLEHSFSETMKFAKQVFDSESQELRAHKLLKDINFNVSSQAMGGLSSPLSQIKTLDIKFRKAMVGKVFLY